MSSSEPLSDAVGERLELPEYYADFQRNFQRAKEFWKLERGQAFAEPGNASWEAFNVGDWDEAMRLLEERREDLRCYHEENAAAGTQTRRIRIVSLPVTPYLHWELHLLKIRDETGGPIRILRAEAVADLEASGSLPDIYTMDNIVMYQAIYDHKGVLECALRYTSKDLVAHCRDFIMGLYSRGEPVGDFFKREIAHLPPSHPLVPAIPQDYLTQTGRPHPIRS
jgi:Family of unknown function (DUF6879)